MKIRLFFIALFWIFFSLSINASPLPASEVFQIEAKKRDPNSFVIHWQIKPGYFLYRDRIKFSEQKNANFHLGTLRFPAAEKKQDKLGRVFIVYRNQLALPVAILGVQPGESLLHLSFQGCSDEGFCYPPETREIKLRIDKNLALIAVDLEQEKIVLNSNPFPEVKQVVSDEMEQLFTDHHWFFIILSFWMLGLLLAFTPCILPMVPILSSIIVGHGEKISTRKAFLLSLNYVLSMSFTYALVGAVIAELGSNLQVLMQTPLSISIFSLIFIVLAFSMFGFYDLRLPIRWQAKLAHANQSQSSGHYLGAALMGCFSTLILSPCVTPPLIGALGYIARSGNIALGSVTLFFLGIGIGTPLLLMGASLGKWLPKTGKWMNAVKAFFGLVLLAMALFLLDRILHPSLMMVLWSSLALFTGIYCGALTAAKTIRAKFLQGLGLLFLVYGLILLIGASMGNINPLQPLKRLETIPLNPITKTVNNLLDLEHAITEAKGKPILLDFYADWCSSCKLMETTLFKNPQVLSILKSFVVLKVDITDNNADQSAILKQFNVIAPPTFVFINDRGNEQSNLRLVGEVPANKFINSLKKASLGYGV